MRPVDFSKTHAPESPGTVYGDYISMVVFWWMQKGLLLYRRHSGLTSKVPVDAEAGREGLSTVELDQSHGS